MLLCLLEGRHLLLHFKHLLVQMLQCLLLREAWSGHEMGGIERKPKRNDENLTGKTPLNKIHPMDGFFNETMRSEECDL